MRTPTIKTRLLIFIVAITLSLDSYGPTFDSRTHARLSCDTVVGGIHIEPKPFRGPNGDPLTPILHQWLLTGTVAGQEIFLSKDGIAQSFVFVEPTPNPMDLDWFLRHIGPRSVGFGFVQGWFGNEPNRSPFHAYVRVGQQVFHLLDDNQIYEEDFRSFEMTLLERRDDPVTYEVVYEASPTALREHSRYYVARKTGTATINGEVEETAYFEGGFGQLRDGLRVENCQTFALSFAQPHWRTDYPILAQIHSGRFAALENGGPETLSFRDIARVFVKTKPSFVVTWGKILNPTEPSYSPYEMLSYLRVVKTYKLTPEDFTVKRTWHRRAHFRPINEVFATYLKPPSCLAPLTISNARTLAFVPKIQLVLSCNRQRRTPLFSP